ncbi:type VI secretion system contractile sheath small subunit, partial [Pseudomonas aeruginosa]
GPFVFAVNLVLVAVPVVHTRLTNWAANPGAEEMIMKANKDPALLQALASAPKQNDDEPQA